MVKYAYDAWGGEHEVLNPDGSVIADRTHIGNLNPYRYRGYYYDVETGLYYLKTRYYDPEVGRFITIDDISYLDPETINGLNLYAYCGNNPVMNVDPTGKFAILSFLLALGVTALVGATVGVVGTFVSDVVCSIFTGEWQFSSWETYLGNAVGGAVGGMLSLIPGVGPFVGTVVGGTLGAFAGLVIGKATGSNSMSWKEIGLYTAISFGVSLVTAGLTQYIKMPGVTQGNHSWQQVFKSGFTKILSYGFSMSAKTILKGAGYLAVSSFTTGFLASNILQGFISAQFYLWNKKKRKSGYGLTYITQG